MLAVKETWKAGREACVMLVGVPSYRHSTALQRRNAIRELMASGGPSSSVLPAHERVSLRFVMAEDQADDADRHRADVWFFALPAARRAKKTYGLEKYLLSNRFLRRAAGLADVPPLVVLADDDTLFNATALMARVAPLATPSREMVFGNVEEWFMWDPVAMISTCFAYSSRRWEVARTAARNASLDSLPRSKRECLLPHTVGPFPYAKGHFLGYSRATVRRLAQLFDCCGDEAYAIGERARRSIAHPFYNKLLAPSHRDHPANKVLTEDVYYMHLLFKALRNTSLTLVHLTLSEYVVERGARALHRADVYHKLKRPDRWEYVRQHASRLLAPASPSAAVAPRCEPMTSRYRVRRGGRLVAQMDHCCERWTWCELSPRTFHSRKRRGAPLAAHDAIGVIPA